MLLNQGLDNLMTLIFRLTFIHNETFPSALFPLIDMHLSGLHQLECTLAKCSCW